LKSRIPKITGNTFANVNGVHLLAGLALIVRFTFPSEETENAFFKTRKHWKQNHRQTSVIPTYFIREDTRKDFALMSYYSHFFLFADFARSLKRLKRNNVKRRIRRKFVEATSFTSSKRINREKKQTIFCKVLFLSFSKEVKNEDDVHTRKNVIFGEN
jgi:hypothetical protein